MCACIGNGGGWKREADEREREKTKKEEEEEKEKGQKRTRWYRSHIIWDPSRRHRSKSARYIQYRVVH